MIKRYAAEIIFLSCWLLLGLLCLFWNAQGLDFYPSRLGRSDSYYATWLFEPWLWIVVFWMMTGASTSCLYLIWKRSENDYRYMVLFCMLLFGVLPAISPSNRNHFDYALAEFLAANLLLISIANAIVSRREKVND